MFPQMAIQPTELTPAQLDAQCAVHIDEWVDIDSERAKDIDPDHALARKWLKMGVEANFLKVDSNGRLWGKGKDGERWFPLHFEYGKKLVGYRISAKAVN